MAISHYEPWSLLNRLHQELNRMQDPTLGGGEDESSVATSDWRPAVDIKEEADRFVIQADVPGVSPDDIHIEMDNGILTISGTRHSESKQAGQGYKRVERTSGSFHRRFSLPDTADAEAISARTEHGVLEVIIPKQAKVQPRRIKVTKG